MRSLTTSEPFRALGWSSWTRLSGPCIGSCSSLKLGLESPSIFAAAEPGGFRMG